MTMTPQHGFPRGLPFPRSLPPDPTAEEIGAYLGDLMHWLTKKKRRDLMQAGFTVAELFDLRRVGNAYRTTALTPELMAKATALMAKLETLWV